MCKNKTIVKDITIRKYFEKNGSKMDYEIMRIHRFLYKFSIDKIEECFTNTSI